MRVAWSKLWDSAVPGTRSQVVTMISRNWMPDDETRSRHHHFARGAKSLQSEPGPTLGRNGRPHIQAACGEARAEENQPDADSIICGSRFPWQANPRAISARPPRKLQCFTAAVGPTRTTPPDGKRKVRKAVSETQHLWSMARGDLTMDGSQVVLRATAISGRPWPAPPPLQLILAFATNA